MNYKSASENFGLKMLDLCKIVNSYKLKYNVKNNIIDFDKNILEQNLCHIVNGDYNENIKENVNNEKGYNQIKKIELESKLETANNIDEIVDKDKGKEKKKNKLEIIEGLNSSIYNILGTNLNSHIELYGVEKINYTFLKISSVITDRNIVKNLLKSDYKIFEASDKYFEELEKIITISQIYEDCELEKKYPLFQNLELITPRIIEKTKRDLIEYISEKVIEDIAYFEDKKKVLGKLVVELYDGYYLDAILREGLKLDTNHRYVGNRQQTVQKHKKQTKKAIEKSGLKYCNKSFNKELKKIKSVLNLDRNKISLSSDWYKKANNSLGLYLRSMIPKKCNK